ncbi:MAG: hypothetical protein AAF197_03280 [Pseudomonadota bacterium]
MTEEVQVYKFTSTGGDELCDSREGVYSDEPPTRPHPHCNCNIASVHNECYTLITNAYFSAYAGDDLEVTFHLEYEVTCWNETGYSSERTKEMVAGRNNTDPTYGSIVEEFPTWVDMEMVDVEIEAEEFCKCNETPDEGEFIGV